MTDKQIIIDGCDVSGCEFYYEQHCKQVVDEDGCYVFLCADDKDCYYKQLKRKEQECEELKGDLYFTNEQLKDFKSHYDKAVEECEELKEKYLKLKEQNGSNIVQLNTVNGQLDQLKAEVKSKTEYIQEQREIINQYSKEIEMYKKCQGKRASKREEELKAENDELRQFLSKEPLALQALQSGYSDYKKRSEVFFEMVQKYKQTLIEIKEIIYFNKANRMAGGACISIEQILQKISECEGNDA